MCISTETHLFTESSWVFPVRWQAVSWHHHQSLPLQTERRLLQSPHNWTPEAVVKPRHIILPQLVYSSLLAAFFNNLWTGYYEFFWTSPSSNKNQSIILCRKHLDVNRKQGTLSSHTIFSSFIPISGIQSSNASLLFTRGQHCNDDDGFTISYQQTLQNEKFDLCECFLVDWL